MYRTDLVLSDRDFNNLSDFIGAFPDYAADTARSVFAQYEPEFLSELRYQPAHPKYPIAWQSERQRKAFFATNGFGRGIPTQRTGQMARGWQAGVLIKENSIRMIVSNDVSHFPYVVGSLRTRRPMQRMHINSGYVPVYRTIIFWANQLNTAFINGFRRTLDAKAP